MEQEDYKPDNFSLMNELCGTFRGKIIQAMTNVEAVIDDTLTEYFCTDPIKIGEFKFAFLTSDYISLSSKWKMLNNILKHHFPKLLKTIDDSANVQLKTPDQLGTSLGSRITKLYQIRNVVAHRIYFSTQEQMDGFDGKTITLKAPKFEDGGWHEDYYPLILDKERVNAIVLEAGIINLIFDKILPIVKRGKDLSDEEISSVMKSKNMKENSTNK